MKKYGSIMKKLLPIVFGTAMSIVLWNILMSELIDRNPLRYFDEILGSRAKPNELYINSSEGYARLRMDRYGFNNDEKNKGE